MRQYKRYQEGRWEDGETISYIDHGNRIKFFIDYKGRWKYEGFINTRKVSEFIPDEYIEGFDAGNKSIMNKFIRKIL